MKKLKIAILSYRSAKFGGGQGVYIKDISKALINSGHEVDVISGPPYPDLVDGIRLIKLPGLNLFESFSFKDRLKKFINKSNKSIDEYYEFISVFLGGFPEPKTFGKRANNYLKENNDYDIVIDNQSISYGLLDIQKRLPLIEIIHHPITFDFKHELESSKKIKYKISRHRWYSFLKMQKKVAPKLNQIITPSKSSQKGISEEFMCDYKNIKVINNGLDASEFIPMPEIERKKNRLITTASADVPLKGLDYSLMAIKALKKDFKDIELIIVGKIKKNGHTERLIKDLNINKSVSFRSELTKKEIAKLYASSSIAIVSSLYEGFGYPVIEAMSCEVPLIATNVSSIPELVGSYASLIEPKSYDEIYKAVKQILLNYDEYERIAVGGRQHIINTFNWSKITTQYEDIITKTIKEHEKC